MTTPDRAAFVRYLSAKKSVDDRALNLVVWQHLARAAAKLAGGRAAPLDVLEIGAGIGTMVERAVERRLFAAAPHGVRYLAIDAEPANIDVARRRLPVRLPHLQLSLEAVDLFDYMARSDVQACWDLVIAHAFLDLVDLRTTLLPLLALLRPGGLLYATINFDGLTILEPALDPAFDAQIETLYHRTMDERRTEGRPSGDSRTGRHLFTHLRSLGVELLSAGSSDWVVFAGPSGYPADEAAFLRFIVDTMEGALAGHPQLDAPRFARWIGERRAQIERGELVYIAHQIDFLGQIGETP